MSSYAELRAQAGTAQRPRRFDEETRRARAREVNRRTSRAQTRAYTALSRAFPDEYRELYNAAKAEVEAESGPMPGDEDGPA